jgi:hypothetical protein
MQYTRGLTLLPLTPKELRLAERVPFRSLPTVRLLLFDETVSDFFFEFEPPEDIDRFLQHSHFGGMVDGRLLACREDLAAVAAIQAGTQPEESLSVGPREDLPLPLRFTPIRKAFEAIGRGGEFRGQVTVCSCGIAGCFSQYVWARDTVCTVLFTINGACLSEVAWLPFRFEIHP